MFPEGKHPLGNERGWAGWFTPNTNPRPKPSEALLANLHTSMQYRSDSLTSLLKLSHCLINQFVSNT